MFQFERGQNLPFDWPVSVSNILTVRWWAEPKIVGRNFTSRIQPISTLRARMTEEIKSSSQLRL